MDDRSAKILQSMPYFFLLASMLICSPFFACQLKNQKLYSDVKIIGGQSATKGQFPGVIALGAAPACSGVVVGSKAVITAAHCVIDSFNNGKPVKPFTIGNQLAFTSDMNLKNAGFKIMTIESIEVHPDYLKLCQAGCLNLSTKSPFPPDIAVIFSRDPIEIDSFAKLDFEPVAEVTSDAEAWVYMVGYGCDGGHNRRVFPQTQQFGFVPITTKENFAGVRRLSEDPESLNKVYISTKGKLLDPKLAALCPGDSGGPIFKIGTNGEMAVVGVNASSWYPSDIESAQKVSTDPENVGAGADDGVPSISLHTRIDDQSQFKVATWLREIL